MSKNFTVRLSEIELEFLNQESERHHIPKVEVIRRAVWSHASLSEIEHRLDETVIREIDRARQLLDAEFELQKAELFEQLTAKIDQDNKASFSQLIEWLKPRLPSKNN